MTLREKIGLAAVVGLFIVLGLLLVKFGEGEKGGVRPAKDSYFVRQRMINLEKGK